ncbi:MAG: hypothetical protein ABSG32_13565 [Terriglobia bacterium]|jgi:hypothetical protein
MISPPGEGSDCGFSPRPAEDIRFPRGHWFTLPKVCYNVFSGSQVEDMRIAIRLLAILTIAALLASGVRWASLRGPMEACACPPAACICTGHHHGFGHLPICSMANGGQCGLGSHDSYLSSLLSNLIYEPTEHPWLNPPATWKFGHDTPDLSLLPSHVRIPEQPPRASL